MGKQPEVDIDRSALWAKVGYTPHTKQELFHYSLARFKVPSCGRRFGKSKMAAMEALPELFRPGTLGWIVGPTYTLGAKEFDYVWEAIVLDMRLGPHLKAKAYNVATGSMYIEMPWGSRLEVKSADHPDGLVGEGLDYVIVSEAAKQRPVVWDKFLRPALADKAPRSWAAFPSTPEGHNWYYELFLRGQKTSPTYSDQYESWNFPSWENHYVYPRGFDDPEIQDQLRSPDDPWFWQEIGADFRSFVGKIYTEWRDEDNILADYAYHPEWRNYMAFDFGFANPFAALDVQIDPEDNIYIWREYYEREKPIHVHAKILAERMNPPGYGIACGFGDYADPGAIETLSMMLCPVWADKDSKDWNRGVQEVKKFLRDKAGKPHLYVHKSCHNTVWEFQNYRMKQQRAEENVADAPKKWADHSMDAIRYLVMHLYVLGARYHLSDVYTPGPVGNGGPVPQEPPVPTGAPGYFTREDSVFTLGGSGAREF